MNFFTGCESLGAGIANFNGNGGDFGTFGDMEVDLLGPPAPLAWQAVAGI